MLRVALLNGTNRNKDKDVSKIIESIVSSGTVKGLNIVAWAIQIWYWFVEVTRSNGDVFFCLVDVTAPIDVDITGTKKVRLEVKQDNINDGSSNNALGTDIAEVKTGASYPSTNFLKVASITSWVVTDDRKLVTVRNEIMTTILNTYASISYVDSAIASAWAITKLTENIYPLWENVVVNDSLFVEDMITFTLATEVLEFGKTTADKRVVLYWVGEWVASNKIKLWLKKFVSPSADVKVRIETVDWSWIATWTLVDANAYGEKLTSWLTTTVVDTEITLNGTFTIPKGMRVAVIVYAWTYGSETINATNYFWIACKTKVTISYWYGLYNTSYTNYTNKMVYFSSALFANTLLSKTSASQVETLPTDYLRLAQTSWARGDIVPVTYFWLHSWFVWINKWSIYFVQDTAWMIWTIPWTKKSIIWVSKDSKTIKLWGNNIVEVWDTVIYSDIAEVGWYPYPVYWGIWKTYISPYIWRVKISFEAKTNNTYWEGRARIYVNWIWVWIERTLGTSYILYTEEINVYYNDLIEIRYWTPWGNYSNVKGFIISWNVSKR